MTKEKSELIFLPLGGAGEIGMNLNLYGYDHAWIMVDCGVTFADEQFPGFDVLMPNTHFIEERRKELKAIVLTHAHEDHIGAVPYLWKRFKCPVYATPFTATLVRKKLEEAGIDDQNIIKEVDVGKRTKIGPFDIEYIALTHSIPEPNGIVIRTPSGTVFHTGDWKLDPNPMLGKPVDEKKLIDLGKEGVDAMVCDSTSVLVPGHSGSEKDVRDELMKTIGKYKEGRLAVGCFATNVARLESIAIAAQHHGRRVALAGRSLWRLDETARKHGYLADQPRFLNEQEGMNLPRHKVLYICTGSQGEDRAALNRISMGNHQSIRFDKDDTVIFSSRMIPGNEKAIGRMQNRLAKLGVNIITAKDADIHVSGHPARDEMKDMYGWVKPRIAIPVHGEYRHMSAHAKLAKECGVPETMTIENGAIVKIGPGKAEVLDRVQTGHNVLDGKRVVPLTGRLIRYRDRVIKDGYAVISVAIDAKGGVRGDVQLTGFGLWDHDEDDDLWWQSVEEVTAELMMMTNRQRSDDVLVGDALTKMLRKSIRATLGKKPVVEVNVIRV